MRSDIETVIRPDRSVTGYWRDLWCYRELLYFLSWRDILLRYKQTMVGIAWSVLRPILTLLVFTFILARPEILLCLTGMATAIRQLCQSCTVLAVAVTMFSGERALWYRGSYVGA